MNGSTLIVLMAMVVLGVVRVSAAESAGAAGATGAIPYGVADKPWDARLGNHRARVRVDKAADAAWAHVPWRRRDARPQDKAVYVVHAATGARVANTAAVAVSRESGDVVFQAAHAGEYDVYYMPFAIRGSSFPTTVYDKPQSTADAAWLKRHGLAGKDPAAGTWRSLPKATVLEFQARREFDRMDPMEVIATADETARLLADHPGRAFLLFPEDRVRPIRMTDDLPLRWIGTGPGDEFRGHAQRNEFYVFQIGVHAARRALGQVRVDFSDLRSPAGGVIPAAALRCFNTGGVDWLGREMPLEVSVPRGKVQALWIGVDIPSNTAAGTYEGTVTVRADGLEPAKVRLVLAVASKVLQDCGDGELWRLSRLRWLDSGIGLEDEVVAPYTPLVVDGRTVRCLGRDLTFGQTGLPRSIRAGGNELLAGPVEFKVALAGANGGEVAWQAQAPKVLGKSPAAVTWQGRGAGGSVTLTCRAKMEFDGYVSFQLSLQSDRPVALADCRLEIPLRREFATYMMGMGRKGGYLPARWDWKWDPRKHQDSLWVGAVDGGLQCKLKGPDYRWPLVNIHYHRRPLVMPEAWHNDGRGGCTVEPAAPDAVVIRAMGGPRDLPAGKELRFDFGLLITPVKPLDYRAHWTHRYIHGGVPSPDEVVQSGARIINIHHANPLNPYINYPFLATDKLSDYVRGAHAKGLKVKIYYTIRELSNHVAELWPLRSLGQEVFAPGDGGGYAWLHEHLASGYSPAWHHRFPDGTWCAAINMMGLSRWHNYYLEGFAWLLRNVQIDGLYLDEIGYDRQIMKRVRRVLDAVRPGSFPAGPSAPEAQTRDAARSRCLLDLHSWNHFNAQAGFANCLNLYMEHMPYLDSLWIGEERNYDEPPDHWMVEISGIPFGLFSEMLQGGGNPWRGMLYGMTNRLPWSGDPRPIWKLWDDFGIQEARMFGYWSTKCPVKTGKKDVLATVYQRKGEALIILATWAPKPVECRLTIDWAALGLDASMAKLRAPAIRGLQKAQVLDPGKALPIQPGGGWMLILGQAR